MAQTSIHISPVKGGSELHNERRKELDYVRKDLTSQNQIWKSEDVSGIEEQHAKIVADYQAAHGKKIHANATPIREAVVVIKQDTTMQQLLAACAKCKEKYGIEAMQIYTHKDEGHTAEDGVWKPNLHAHIIYNWYNFNTHTTHKLSRQDMAEMQTLFAECLNMERGVSSDRKHLNAIQQKNQAEAYKLQHLLEQIQQQAERHRTELAEECKDLRKSGRETVKAFDYLCKFAGSKPTKRQRTFRDNLEQELSRELPTETKDLSEHANELRSNLMNTINAVTHIGKQLQGLASRIPLLKRRRLSHEAELEKTAEEAEQRAAEATKSAEMAKARAIAEEDAAAAAKEAARQREQELRKMLLNLEERIEEARKEGWNKAYVEKYEPIAKENERLLLREAQLEESLRAEISAHEEKAVDTARMLIQHWGAALFEQHGFEFTTYRSWKTAKEELRKKQEAQQPIIKKWTGRSY